MAVDRRIIGVSVMPQRRAGASGCSASARPRAPGRAGANPAGNFFRPTAHMRRGGSHPNFLLVQQSPSSSPNFAGALLDRCLVRVALRNASRPNHRDTGDVGKIRKSVGSHE